MPVCPFCKKEVHKNSNLFMVNNQIGKIALSCKNCIRFHQLEEIDDDRQEESGLGIPSISKENFLKIEKELLKNINSTLDEISEKKTFLENKVAYKRAHKREDVNLDMQFSFVRDNKMYSANVLDISKGGMRFETEIPVMVGNKLKSVILTPVSDGKLISTTKSENYLEVRRSIHLDKDMYQVGGSFLKKIGVDEKNRRKHNRKDADFSFHYLRKDSEISYRGNVLNISQGGMICRVYEEFEIGEKMKVIMRATPPAFVCSDITADFKVSRIEELAENIFSIAGEFTKIDVVPVEP